MILVVSPQARKQIKKLPSNIQKKTKKQFYLLLSNYRHPSLRTSKMSSKNTYEARIDLHYRFRFMIEEDKVYILTAGMHDFGLGKK